MERSIYLGKRTDSGGKESDKARHAVFFTPLNPFGENPDEKEPHDDYAVPQKVHCHGHWKRNQDAVYWIKLSKAQELGLQFWQGTKGKNDNDRFPLRIASRKLLASEKILIDVQVDLSSSQ